MNSKCNVCGTNLDNGQPQANGMCIDCLADKWGEIVEQYPICSQLHSGNPESDDIGFEVEYDIDNNDYILIVDSIKQTIGSGTTVMELYDIAMNMRTDE